jgi:hypothetical protein
MEKIIEAVLALIPFGKWLELIGLNKETSAILSLIVTATLGYVVVKGLKSFQKWRDVVKAAKDLKPEFDYFSIGHLYLFPNDISLLKTTS